MARIIDSYQPYGDPPGWPRVAAEVRRTIAAAEPRDRRETRELLGVLAKLALFAHGEGFPADVKSWLTRPMIERFVAVGCAELQESTRGNYRTRLLRLREAVLRVDNPTGKPIKYSSSAASTPYTESETAALWSWAGGQPTEEMRLGCKLLLTLGLGCGLDAHEIIHARINDIRHVDNGAVVTAVRGSRPRLVICRARWETFLADLTAKAAAHHPDGFLFRPEAAARGKNTVTNFLSRTHPSPDTPTLVVGRLRVTWLIELMNACLPLPVILAASGLDTLHGLSRLIPHLDGVTAQHAQAALRGAR